MRFVPAELLKSPKLRAVRTWYEAGSVSGWPSREAFRPEVLPGKVLPHIGLVDVETSPFRVFYRVLGSVLTESVDRRIHMQYLDELDLPQEAELLALYRYAIEADGPLFVKGEQGIGDEHLSYEGACFPLGQRFDPVRRFVIGEDFLDTRRWREALRRRHYRIEQD